MVAQKAVLCKLLGVCASRVVYALGTDFAIKYEYAEPMSRVSNRKEARIARDFQSMLPWTFELDNGCLLVRQAPYTLEHLMGDFSNLSAELAKLGDQWASSPLMDQFLNFCSLLKGAMEWAVWLVDFAVMQGVRLKDASPCNAGYDVHDKRWKVIDAGCFTVVARPRDHDCLDLGDFEVSPFSVQRAVRLYSSFHGLARCHDGRVRQDEPNRSS